MADGRINLDLVNNKGEDENSENKDWSILLPELLGLVMSRLIVKDNICASAVCKVWYKSSVSIHKKNRPLWFMKHPLSSNINRPCELFDPSQDMTYIMEFPEIADMSIYYSKDGWLLMHKDHSSEMCFFNPFIRVLISLPTCKSYNECAIFTCAPTSDRCLVFGLTNIDFNNNIVAVNTFRVGETEWKTSLFMSLERFFAYYKKIIFSGGLFYCFGGLGSLAVFDPSKQTWNTHCLKYEEGFFAPSTATWFGTYFIETKGDIFLLKTLGKKPRVFRLNRDGGWIWEEKDTIGEGLTFFGASRASEFRSGLADDMKNKLLLSDSHHPMINTYLFGEGKYLLGTSCIPFWDGKTKFQTIWIEPPKQCLDFI
ncbi:unnamed protein product [Arabis nemorensis]|uniref:KIB1-4 beta-propeller domain-containing protein n=1 Tax=Arabis nemorensis TaxID=586526 RepID=A0A565CHE7_9BRAS|nr:unnamed protein product [Arabis nemorensis]